MRTNRKIRIVALLITISLFTDVKVYAQIKVVGNEYADSLTASKSYYEKDIAFEKIFPKISLKEQCARTGTTLAGLYRTIDLTGDTVYLQEDLKRSGKYRASFCVTKNGEVVPDLFFMPKGYYVISGYVFCSENEDLVRASYGLDYGREMYYDKIRGWDVSTIKYLKEDILKGRGDRIEYYIRYVIFQSLDTATKMNDEAVTFYLQKDDVWGPTGMLRACDKMAPLSFYNEASSFIGESVVLTSNGWREVLKKYDLISDYEWEWDMVANNAYDSIYRDPLSDRLVKIKDEYFEVRDVVMKDKMFYIVLEGEKTGSFSCELSFIEYANNHWDMDRREGYEVGGKEKNPKFKDIPCLFAKSTNNNWRHYIIIIKKNDIAILDKRAQIAKDQKEKEWKQQEQRERQEREKRNAVFTQQMVSKHGAKYGEMIGKRQVSVGMTQEMCRDAWGRPMNTYRTTTSYGQSEVWCYNYKTRVYFHNGKVVQIDD